MRCLTIILLCFTVAIKHVESQNQINLADNQTRHAVVRKRETLECESSEYSNNVLKLNKEAPIEGLFRDLKNHTAFEASGVIAIGGNFYIVFDNSMSVGHVDAVFAPRGENNYLIGDMGSVSEFEGIAYVPENDTMLLLRESEGEKDDLKPEIAHVKLRADKSTYGIIARCTVDFKLTDENKGWESILYIRTLEGEAYLLGLCEGNDCEGGSEGQEPGKGRIIVTQLDQTEEGCAWNPVKTINIPESAFFTDYSGMSINQDTGKIAIVSQENAAVWIGNFDVNAIAFASQEGTVYHMPRDGNCEIIYCNVEGIQWLDNSRLLVVSDQAKSDQPSWCEDKDQSIHIFALPPNPPPGRPVPSSPAAPVPNGPAAPRPSAPAVASGANSKAAMLAALIAAVAAVG